MLWLILRLYNKAVIGWYIGCYAQIYLLDRGLLLLKRAVEVFRYWHYAAWLWIVHFLWCLGTDEECDRLTRQADKHTVSSHPGRQKLLLATHGQLKVLCCHVMNGAQRASPAFMTRALRTIIRFHDSCTQNQPSFHELWIYIVHTVLIWCGWKSSTSSEKVFHWNFKTLLPKQAQETISAYLKFFFQNMFQSFERFLRRRYGHALQIQTHWHIITVRLEVKYHWHSLRLCKYIHAHPYDKSCYSLTDDGWQNTGATISTIQWRHHTISFRCWWWWCRQWRWTRRAEVPKRSTAREDKYTKSGSSLNYWMLPTKV